MELSTAQVEKFLPRNKIYFLFNWKCQNEILLENLENHIDDGVDEWDNELLKQSRVANYMRFLYTMFSESLYAIIIDYQGECRKKDLKKAYEEIEIYKDRIADIIDVAEHSKDADCFNKTPVGILYKLKLQNIWGMEREIECELEKDMHKKIEDGNDWFKELDSFSHRFVSEYESNRKLLLEINCGRGTSKPDYKKLEKAINFTGQWSMINGFLGNLDDIRLIYVIYHEIIDNNVRIGNGLIAKTIVSKLNAENEIEISEEIFINKKIQRGFFWLLELQEEYHIYNEIMKMCRELLSDVWRIPDDLDRFVMLNDIGIKVEDILMNIT